MPVDEDAVGEVAHRTLGRCRSSGRPGSRPAPAGEGCVRCRQDQEGRESTVRGVRQQGGYHRWGDGCGGGGRRRGWNRRGGAGVGCQALTGRSGCGHMRERIGASSRVP
jgi:hypothetical protein